MTDFNESEQAALEHARGMLWEYMASISFDVSTWTKEQADDIANVIVSNYLQHLAWQKQQASLHLASNSLERANSIP